MFILHVVSSVELLIIKPFLNNLSSSRNNNVKTYFVQTHKDHPTENT